MSKAMQVCHRISVISAINSRASGSASSQQAHNQPQSARSVPHISHGNLNFGGGLRVELELPPRPGVRDAEILTMVGEGGSGVLRGEQD
jgi:hypothetical protein